MAANIYDLMLGLGDDETPSSRARGAASPDLDSAADRFGVPRELARALVGMESGGRDDLVSRKGARGRTQVMPNTMRQMGYDPDTATPEDYVDAGMQYLRENYDRFGRWDLALAAYHAGPGAVRDGRIPNTTDGLTRTPDYVRRILSAAQVDPAADPRAQAPARPGSVYDLMLGGSQPQADDFEQRSKRAREAMANAPVGFFEEAGRGLKAGIERLGAGGSALIGRSDQTIASDLADVAQVPRSAAQQQYEQQLKAATDRFDQASGFAESTGAVIDIIKAVFGDPTQAARTTVESLASSSPAFAGAAAGALAGAAVPLPGASVIGGIIGYLGGSLATNTQVEMASRLDEALREKGVDTADPQATIAALQANPTLVPDARSKAIQAGLATTAVEGVVDLATVGTAKITKPARSLIGTAMRAGAAVGAQGVGEGLGAYAGDLAAGDEPSAGGAIAEGLMGMIPGAPEAAAAVYAGRKLPIAAALTNIAAATTTEEVVEEARKALAALPEPAIKPDNWEVVDDRSPRALPPPDDGDGGGGAPPRLPYQPLDPTIVADERGNARFMPPQMQSELDAQRGDAQRRAIYEPEAQALANRDLGLSPDGTRNAVRADGGLVRDQMAQPQADSVPRESVAMDGDYRPFAPESGSLGVPRADMPQVRPETHGPLVNFLKARGVESRMEEVPAGSLRPTQAEYSPTKVEGVRAEGASDRRVLVSSDGYVVDGHHRWLASYLDGAPVKTIRFDAPAAQLLDLVREFPSAGQSDGGMASGEGSSISVSPNRATSPSVDPARAAAEAAIPVSPLPFAPSGQVADSSVTGEAVGSLPTDRAPEPARNGAPAYSEVFGDSLESQSLRAKGVESLDVKQKAVVQARMLRSLQDPKILEAVIQLVPVDVMNVLVAGKRTADGRFDNQAVLEGLAPRSFGLSVAVRRFIDSVAAALPDALAGPVAEEQSVDGRAPSKRADKNRRSAGRARGTDPLVEGRGRAGAENGAARPAAAESAPGTDSERPGVESGSTVGARGEHESKLTSPDRAHTIRLAQFVEERAGRAPVDELAAQHRDWIEAALEDGKSIAPDVLRDHPAVDEDDHPLLAAAVKNRLALDARAPKKREAEAVPVAPPPTGDELALTPPPKAKKPKLQPPPKRGERAAVESPAPVAQPAERGPIVDAGEKIGGARKDWRDRGLNLDDLEAMTESEGATVVTKQNVWKPDWEAMAAANSGPVSVAMVKVLYDQLAAKPKANTPEGRRRYVRMMQIVREVYSAARSVRDVQDGFRAIREKVGVTVPTGIGSGFTQNPDAAELKDARATMFSVYKGRSDPFTLSVNELLRAKKLVEDGFPTKIEPWRTRFAIRRRDGSRFSQQAIDRVRLDSGVRFGMDPALTDEQIRAGYFEVVAKSGGVQAMHATEEDAIAAARTLYAQQLKEARTEEKQPERPHLDVLKREGLPPSIERDATPDDMLRDFGFRGIEWGNWAAQDERQRMLNMAYDALADLAKIMRVPRSALSLNGTLGLAFGARGGGRFAAHYEPGKLVINITKLRGAGSLAHEWAHAVDHYFGELERPDAYNTAARGASGWYSEEQYNGLPRTRFERNAAGERVPVERMRLANLRPELAVAFDGVMRALFQDQLTQAQMIREQELAIERAEGYAAIDTDPAMKRVYQARAAELRKVLDDIRRDPEGTLYAGRGRTDYAKEAQNLSGKSSNGYWLRPTEMFARAFEAWVFDKLVGMGARSDFLVHGVESDRFTGGDYKGNPYPAGVERERINAAFDNLVATIKTREEGPRAVMFSRVRSQADATMREVIDVARAPGNENRSADLGPVAEATRDAIRQTLGVDVSGFRHVADAFAVRHVLKKHGNAEVEEARGLRAVTERDLEQLPQVLAAPDALIVGLKNRVGRDLVFSVRRLEDGTTLIAQEVRTGRGALALASMRKVPGTKNARELLPSVLLNARDDTRQAARVIDLADGDKEGVSLWNRAGPSAPSAEAAPVDPSGQSSGTNVVRSPDVDTGQAAEQPASPAAPAESGGARAAAAERQGAERPRAPGARDEAGEVGGGEPAAQRATARTARGLPIKRLTRIVDGIRSRWSNAPDIEIVASADDLPQRIREEIGRQEAGGAEAAPRGVYWQGRVYLVADQLVTHADVVEVVMHESLGHYGLRGVFGARLNPLLDRIAMARPAQMREKARDYGLNLASLEERRAIAEELLAEMAQASPELDLVQRIIAAIRAFLRDVLGLPVAWSDADIIARAILPARRFVERGPAAGARPAAAGAAAASAPSAPFYSELARRIGAAKSSAMPAAEWAKWLDANAAKLGIKADEVEWSGVREYLALRGKERTTKEEILDFLGENGVQIGQTVLGAAPVVEDPAVRLREMAPEEMRVLEDAGVRVVFDGEGDGRATMFIDVPNEVAAAADARIEASISTIDSLWDSIRNDYDEDDFGPTGGARYSGYKVPGGEDYRELLLTLPGRGGDLEARLGDADYELMVARRNFGENSAEVSEARARRELLVQRREKFRLSFRSGHWDESNVLVHTRFDTRTDADGRKVLFVHEIQSDWGQAGRKKGFRATEAEIEAKDDEAQALRSQASAIERQIRDRIRAFRDANPDAEQITDKLRDWRNEQADQIADLMQRSRAAQEEAGALRRRMMSGTPRAPFVTDTKAWVALALKRLIRHAAESGHERVVLTTGEQAAETFDLSKQIGKIRYGTNPSDGTYNLAAYATDGSQAVTRERITLNQVEDLVGKEIAAKMERGEGSDRAAILRESRGDHQRELSGLDLKVGGEGMRAFYDRLVPQVARDVVKKLGAGSVTTQEMQISGAGPGSIDRASGAVLGPDADRVPGVESQNVAIDITPELRSKAMAGLPMFQRGDRPAMARPPRAAASASPADDISSYLGTLTPEQERAARRVGLIKPRKTMRERMEKARARLGVRMRQGIVDQFAAIKDIDQKAYVLSRLTKGSDGTLEALMLYGKPYLRDDVPDVRIEEEGGFAKVLAGLQGEHDRFLLWVAAQRAERLKAEGRENLFTDDDISALKTLDANDAAQPERRQRFANALIKLNRYNEAVLNIAYESGLIDDEAMQLFKDQPYVPFYRVMEDENAPSGPRFSTGLVNQYAYKKLKGGDRQLNQDLLANVVQNWSHLIAASARNRAAARTLGVARELGVAAEAPWGTKGTVKVMEAGVAKLYTIDDPMLYEAVSAMEWNVPSWFRPFSTFKRWLTIGVTANPAFKIRNLIRDSLSAISQNELRFNPVANVAQGFKATARSSQTFASMLASGGVIRFGSMIEGDRAHHAHRLIEKAAEDGNLLDENGWQRLRGKVMDVVEVYNELGDRGENANRAALYEQLIAKGYDHADASFMARDLIDFSMSGRWPVVRFLVQTVPFMNARLQGLYKLGRSAKEDPRRFAYMAGAVSLASLALLWAYSEDDDWKKREDWDRDANWWFKIGDTAFRIPKPFELGAIGTLVERTWELATDDEMTWKRYGARLSAMAASTFALSPVPQIVKPMVDVYANQDAFTGRPIESFGMERLRPQDRYTERTSEVAKLLGQLGLPDPAQLAMGRYKELSPVQMDALVRGYFGWLGTSVATALDYGIRPMLEGGERPDMRLRDVFLAGNFVESLPAGSSRYVTQLYEQAREIDQAYASYREALKRGDPQAAREILESERERIAKRETVTRVRNELADIATQMRRVQNSPTMPGDEKRRRLDQLEQRRGELAREPG